MSLRDWRWRPISAGGRKNRVGLASRLGEHGRLPALALWVCILLWLMPLPAQAFSLADRFAVAAQDGGGGGRHFTGSLADGLDCSSCHTGGGRAPWQIAGLPVETYVPSQPYDIELYWPGPVAKAAVALEWLDRNQRSAGTMALLPPEAHVVEERCTDAENSFPVRVGAVGAARQVLTMDGCGANLVRLRWTAPDASVGAVWFHAVHVRGNDSNTPEGDAFASTAVLVQQAPAAGQVRISQSGCQLASSGTMGAAGLFWAWLWLPLWCWRCRCSGRSVPQE